MVLPGSTWMTKIKYTYPLDKQEDFLYNKGNQRKEGYLWERKIRKT